MCRRQCVWCGSWRDLYWWRKLSKSSRRQLRGSCNELNQSGKFFLSKTSHYRPKPIQSLRRNVKLALFMKVVSALQNTNYSGQSQHGQTIQWTNKSSKQKNQRLIFQLFQFDQITVETLYNGHLRDIEESGHSREVERRVNVCHVYTVRRKKTKKQKWPV